MIVIGMIQKHGEYQGREYDNVYLHCTTSDENAVGELTEVVKVKTSEVRKVFGKPMSAADWGDLLGKEIRVYYGRYGNVDEVRVCEDSV